MADPILNADQIFSDNPVMIGFDDTYKKEVVVDQFNFKEMVTPLAEEYYRIRQQIAELDAKKKEIGQRILSMIGTGAKIKLDDGLVVTTIDATVQNRFNSTKFKKDYPDLAAEYLTESKVSAQTRISGKLLDE